MATSTRKLIDQMVEAYRQHHNLAESDYRNHLERVAKQVRGDWDNDSRVFHLVGVLLGGVAIGLLMVVPFAFMAKPTDIQSPAFLLGFALVSAVIAIAYIMLSMNYRRRS